MKLESPSFKHGEKIPSKYTCDEDDINPELIIREVPPEAKSLVLIMDDPDVPEYIRKDKMWDHWIVFNIPPQTTHILENSQPQGLAGKNTGGKLDYQGPCPPDKEHRYYFKLYALSCLLSLQKGATKKQVEEAMSKHILAQAELMGRYEKKSE